MIAHYIVCLPCSNLITFSMNSQSPFLLTNRDKNAPAYCSVNILALQGVFNVSKSDTTQMLHTNIVPIAENVYHFVGDGNKNRNDKYKNAVLLQY